MAKPFPVLVYVQRPHALDFLDRVKKIEGVTGWELPELNKPNGAAKASEAHEPRAPRAPRKAYGESGEETIIKTLYSKAPLTNSQLGDAFEAAGRSRYSINSVIHGLKGKGEIELGENGYSLSRKARDRMRHRNKKTSHHKKK